MQKLEELAKFWKKLLEEESLQLFAKRLHGCIRKKIDIHLTFSIGIEILKNKKKEKIVEISAFNSHALIRSKWNRKYMGFSTKNLQTYIFQVFFFQIIASSSTFCATGLCTIVFYSTLEVFLSPSFQPSFCISLSAYPPNYSLVATVVWHFEKLS